MNYSILNYIIWDVNHQIFPQVEWLYWLRWYGLMWAVGMLSAFQVMNYIYKKEGRKEEELSQLSLYLVIGIIIGARLGHIFFYEPHLLLEPIKLLPFRLYPYFEFTGLAGLASHGGVLGALIALYLYNRKKNTTYLWYLDRMMIAGVLLGAFIRLGNLMNSEIIGSPTNVPWAFIFVKVNQLPRHPSQLYEALFYFSVFILFFLLYKKQVKATKFKNGYFFGLGLILVFTQRFLVEFLKANQVDFESNLPLNMGQFLSIPLILVGVYFVFQSQKKYAAKVI